MIIIDPYNMLNYLIQIIIASIVAVLMYHYLKNKETRKEEDVHAADKFYNYIKSESEKYSDLKELSTKLQRSLNVDYISVVPKFHDIINKKSKEIITQTNFFEVSNIINKIPFHPYALTTSPYYDLSYVKTRREKYNIRSGNNVQIQHQTSFYDDLKVLADKASSKNLEFVEAVKKFDLKISNDHVEPLVPISEKYKNVMKNVMGEVKQYFLTIAVSMMLIWMSVILLMSNASKNSIFYANFGLTVNTIVGLIVGLSVFINLIATFYYLFGRSNKLFLSILIAVVNGSFIILYSPALIDLWNNSIFQFAKYYFILIFLASVVGYLIFRIKSRQMLLNLSFIFGYLALAILNVEIMLRLIIFIRTHS